MNRRYELLSANDARNIADFNRKLTDGKSLRNPIRPQQTLKEMAAQEGTTPPEAPLPEIYGEGPLPYIVIIVDELADLMMLAPEDTERGITRLAQMSRATGIHMIIATQRPSVDVVTGLIKANFPARIAFAVASSTDSRVILDATGAERLLGQGDMLFQSPDAAAPVRMQGCFVNEIELHNIIEYWHRARIQNRQEIMARTEPELEPESSPPAAPTPSGSAVEATTADQAPQTTSVRRETPKPKPKPSPPPAVPPPPVKAEETELPPIVTASTQLEPAQPALWEELEEEMKKEEEEAEKYSDELLPEAIALVRKLNKASTSLLQRRFRIGYTRAARMIDIMEEDGIIGPPTGTSKAREILSLNEEPEQENQEEGEAR
jgi:S-DNA-T family DNA segregation ATPase FtsK/SpoIIIE